MREEFQKVADYRDEDVTLYSISEVPVFSEPMPCFPSRMCVPLITYVNTIYEPSEAGDRATLAAQNLLFCNSDPTKIA